MSIEEIPQGADVNVIPKNEKKARELIKKLNLKQIKGISRVTFKQRGNLIYAIDSPDVYRSAAGTYVVFGEAKVDDMNQRIAEAQAQQAQQEALQKAHGAEVYVGCLNNSISEIWYFYNLQGSILTGTYKPIDTTTNTKCKDEVWYIPK